MKKFILSVVAAAMILSNGAFAGTKTSFDNNDTKVISSGNIIILQSQDPKGW